MNGNEAWCIPVPPGKKPVSKPVKITDSFGKPGSDFTKYCAASRAIYCEQNREKGK